MSKTFSPIMTVFFDIIDNKPCDNAETIADYMNIAFIEEGYTFNKGTILKRIQRVNDNEYFECCIMLKDTTSKHCYYRLYAGMPTITENSPMLAAFRDGGWKTFKGDVTHERRTIRNLIYLRNAMFEGQLKKDLTRIIEKKIFIERELDEILERITG